MSLNPQQLAALLQAQQQEMREQVLFEFNCGTMEMRADRTVHADSRKGKVVLSMEDDGLLRFQWRLRHSDNNELQFLIFPQGATWKRVNECKDGVVYVLRLADAPTPHFFWLQEPADEKGSQKRENEILRRLQQLINDPPKFGQPLPAMPEEDETEGTPRHEEGTESMTDVSTIEGGTGGIATVSGTGLSDPVPRSEDHRGARVSPAQPTLASTGGAAGSGSGGSLNASQLLSTLNSMAQQLQARQEAAAQGHTVNDVLEPDRVQPILDVDRALVDALVQYLPEGQRSPEALRQQLRSPQMQQTMSRLTEILNSAEFGQLMTSLSLPSTGGLGVDAFIQAIQQQATRQQQEQSGQGQGQGQQQQGGDKKENK